MCDADLDVLASLVDKSLVRRRTGDVGEDRFWMLETILEFAAEQLREAGESDELARRHARRMLAVARSAGLEDDDLSPGQNHAVVAAERDDMLRALDWCLVHDVVLGLELAVSLEGYLVAVDPAEGARLVGRLLGRCDDLDLELEPRLEAAALRVMSGGLYRSGDREAAQAVVRRSLAAFEALGDERRVASLEGRLAVHASYYGDTEDARARAEHVSKRATELGMPRLETQALSALASIAVREGDLDAARELFHRSAVVARGCGFTWWEANTWSELLDLELNAGNLDAAERAGRDALLGRTVDRGAPRDAVRTRGYRAHRRWSARTSSGLDASGARSSPRWNVRLRPSEMRSSGTHYPSQRRTTLASSTPWPSAEPRGSRPRSSLPSPTLRPSRRAGGSPTRTASCRRRGRARGRRARPGSSRRARA